MPPRTKIGELVWSAAHGAVARTDIERWLAGIQDFDVEMAEKLAFIQAPAQEALARERVRELDGWSDLTPLIQEMCSPRKTQLASESTIAAMKEAGATHRGIGTNLFLTDAQSAAIEVLATRLGIAQGRLVNWLVCRFAETVMEGGQ